MTVVRESTFIGRVLMDAIDARPDSWTINLHRVPLDEFEQIQQRVRERGGHVESINHDGVAIRLGNSHSYAHMNLWPEHSA